MSEETLFTAARRLMRFVNVDLNHNGGLLTEETQKALLDLERQVERENRRQKIEEQKSSDRTPAK